MKKHYKTVFFIIGLFGIVLMAMRANPEKLDWKELFTPKLLCFFMVLFLLWALIYAVHTEVFRAIIGKDADKISRLRLYKIIITGFALNNVTPAGLVGGEPYRILELKKYLSTEKAASSTISFSLMYVLGHILLWLTGIVIYFFTKGPGETFITVIMIISGLIMLGITLYFLTFRHKALVKPVFNLLSGLPGIGKKVNETAAKNAELYNNIDRSYEELCADRKKIFKIILLEYTARLLESLEYYLIFRYLGAGLHIGGGILILTCASLIGNLLFMVPMQAGTREGGMIIALTKLSIDPGTGVMGGLIYRMRDLFCTALGILLILTDKGKKKEKSSS